MRKLIVPKNILDLLELRFIFDCLKIYYTLNGDVLGFMFMHLFDSMIGFVIVFM